MARSSRPDERPHRPRPRCLSLSSHCPAHLSPAARKTRHHWALCSSACLDSRGRWQLSVTLLLDLKPGVWICRNRFKHWCCLHRSKILVFFTPHLAGEAATKSIVWAGCAGARWLVSAGCCRAQAMGQRPGRDADHGALVTGLPWRVECAMWCATRCLWC